MLYFNLTIGLKEWSASHIAVKLNEAFVRHVEDEQFSIIMFTVEKMMQDQGQVFKLYAGNAIGMIKGS